MNGYILKFDEFWFVLIIKDGSHSDDYFEFIFIKIAGCDFAGTFGLHHL